MPFFLWKKWLKKRGSASLPVEDVMNLHLLKCFESITIVRAMTPELNTSLVGVLLTVWQSLTLNSGAIFKLNELHGPDSQSSCWSGGDNGKQKRLSVMVFKLESLPWTRSADLCKQFNPYNC